MATVYGKSACSGWTRDDLGQAPGREGAEQSITTLADLELGE
jgi:hypothetical protein